MAITIAICTVILISALGFVAHGIENKLFNLNRDIEHHFSRIEEILEKIHYQGVDQEMTHCLGRIESLLEEIRNKS